MYVETNRLHRNGKNYRTVTVRESFRVDGKVTHHTVANLTDLPQHAIDAVQQALRLRRVPSASSDWLLSIIGGFLRHAGGTP